MSVQRREAFQHAGDGAQLHRGCLAAVGVWRRPTPHHAQQLSAAQWHPHQSAGCVRCTAFVRECATDAAVRGSVDHH
jgi:hypothetical protein